MPTVATVCILHRIPESPLEDYLTWATGPALLSSMWRDTITLDEKRIPGARKLVKFRICDCLDLVDLLRRSM